MPTLTSVNGSLVTAAEHYCRYAMPAIGWVWPQDTVVDWRGTLRHLGQVEAAASANVAKCSEYISKTQSALPGMASGGHAIWTESLAYWRAWRETWQDVADEAKEKMGEIT